MAVAKAGWTILFALAVLTAREGLAQTPGERSECQRLGGVIPENGTVVPTNFRIYLEGHRLGTRFSQAGTAWLEAPTGERVLLRSDVVRFTNGFQAVLAPERALAPRTRYTFRTRDPFLFGALEEVLIAEARMASRLDRQVPPPELVWTTADGPDVTPPSWKAPLASASPLIGSRCSRCPRERAYAMVRPNVTDEWPSELYRVRVVDGSVRTTEFLEQGHHATRSEENLLLVGRACCSLVPLASGSYRLTLTAIDLAGNEAQAPGPPLDITVPFPKPPPPVWEVAPAVMRVVSTEMNASAAPEEPAWQLVARRFLLFVVAPFALGYLAVAVRMRLLGRPRMSA